MDHATALAMIAITLLAAGAAMAAEQGAYPAPAPLADPAALGAGIQRTMTLLATSAPEHRHTVRILFYGQSITKQDWWKPVADDLRRRFPNADLDIRNRAIGGFAAQLLVRTAEHDLYPFYPDLLIFHVYGDHRRYEDIIRETRSRTTAEILMQTDHITAEKELTEEMDPAKLTPANWSAWMNHAFLPETARKYGAELLDQRAEWRRYLQDNRLAPAALLSDGVHLNAHGNWLMAELVKRRLVLNPKFTPDANLVRTYAVGADVKWEGGRLRLEFEGNRVDVLPRRPGGKAAAVRVLIDGKKPSEFPGCYVITRPNDVPGKDWPWQVGGPYRITWQKPLVVEDWTLRVTECGDDAGKFRFEVSGSKTGPDGGGTNEQRFVSNSGRVVIEPQDWFTKRLDKTPLIAKGFEAKWSVVPMFVDRYEAPKAQDPSREQAATLAQGLPNAKHTLELAIEGEGDPPVEAIRAYRPPVK